MKLLSVKNLTPRWDRTIKYKNSNGQEYSFSLQDMTFYSSSSNESSLTMYLYKGSAQITSISMSGINPHEILPKGDFSLTEKILARFTAAAENDTDVDLRFCTGPAEKRNPAHDNLREEYGKRGLRF